MASPMGPPMLPGYSLRVQLYSPNAHAPEDKPLRCFRVVTSPELSIRDFCEEASRIHEINYGGPLAIKKVQDDQEFDITQSEILGNLFATTSIIRIIQASTNATVRDSVPPTSALRFEPLSRKREREGSPRQNGVPANSWMPNKRQRVADLDPDEPLPSRELSQPRINGRKPDTRINPVSPGFSAVNGGFAQVTSPRSDKLDNRRVSETPSPPPNPILHSSTSSKNGTAQSQLGKLPYGHLNESDAPSPLYEASVRAQANPTRAKSASYHIQRPMERGRSVSTAATSSSLSFEKHVSAVNGVAPSGLRTRLLTEPILPKPKGAFKSLSEDELYERIDSSDETSNTLMPRNETLKIKSSSSAGLPGLERMKKKIDTPSNSNRRTSASREATTPGQLPLTPSSKERQRRQESDDIKQARIAAAEATQQRQREASGQRRIQREEKEQDEAKRKVVIAKAERLQREREEKESNAAAEEKQKAEQQAEEARLVKFAEAEWRKAEKEREKLEADRSAREIAEADEARLLHEESQKRRLRMSPEREKSKSTTPEQPRLRQSEATILPQGRSTSSSRPQSSTPLIPMGRKSALRSSLSGSAVGSSSPERSPAISGGVGIETQMPLPPNFKDRRVSFDIPEKSETQIGPQIRSETPVMPPMRVLPGKSTPHSKLADAKKEPTPQPSKMIRPVSKPFAKTVLPPSRQSNSPILPPGYARRTSSTLSSSAMQSSAASNKEASPQVAPRRSIPLIKPPMMKKETPILPPSIKITPKLIVPPAKITPVIISSEEDSDSDASESDEDEEEDEEPTPKPVIPSKSQTRIPNEAAKSPISRPLSKSVEPDEDDEETQSQNSSTRDSRSPVVFSSSKVERKGSTTIKIEHRSVSPKSDSESEDNGEEARSGSEEEPDKDNKATMKHPSHAAEDVDMQSDSSSDEEEDEENEEVQIPNSSPPPSLPALKSAIISTVNSGSTLPGLKPRVNNSKDSNSDSGQDTQDEVDQQLTSSFLEVLQPSSSAIRSSSVPSSTTTTRPKFGLGASLSSLNANKPLFGSQSMKPTAIRPLLKELDEDEEESEEESDESSDEEEAPKQTPRATSKQHTPSKNPKKPQNSGSDSYSNSSGSDSDSHSDDDSEKTEAEIIRKELSRSIKGLDNSGINGLSSPMMSQRLGTRSSQSSAKKVDKYVSRQVFQPFGKFT